MPEFGFKTETDKGTFSWNVLAESQAEAENRLRATLLFFPSIEVTDLMPCRLSSTWPDNVNVIGESANPLCGRAWWEACGRLEEFKRRMAR